MEQVSHAIDVFFAHVTAIGWQPLAIALVFQLLKTAARTAPSGTFLPPRIRPLMFDDAPCLAHMSPARA